MVCRLSLLDTQRYIQVSFTSRSEAWKSAAPVNHSPSQCLRLNLVGGALPWVCAQDETGPIVLSSGGKVISFPAIYESLKGQKRHWFQMKRRIIKH